MKTLRFVGMALLAVALCVNLSACSDDDEGQGQGGPLAGTTWRIATSEEGAGMVGIEITFRSDGTFAMSRDGWAYSKWSLDGDVLTLTVGESGPDDYMEGTVIINGDDATYTYHWGDVDGEWEDNVSYTMTLRKQ